MSAASGRKNQAKEMSVESKLAIMGLINVTVYSVLIIAYLFWYDFNSFFLA